MFQDIIDFVYDHRKNYIDIDIFYKELKYQCVNQRASFELMSLLSERISRAVTRRQRADSV